MVASSPTGLENKLSILHGYLTAHGMRLNPSKSWCLNLTVNKGVDPDIWLNEIKIPMAGCSELYNGWSLEAARGGKAWQTKAHLNYRYKHSRSVAQSLMSLTKSLGVPTLLLSSGLYRALVEPELIYACESSFDAPVSTNLQYNCLQLKFLRFCLGLPSNTCGDLILWDMGQLSLVHRRIQLTSRFFAHVALLLPDRLPHHAIRDFISLRRAANRGWFTSFVRRAPLEVPFLDDFEGCLVFPTEVATALKGIQWEEVCRVVSTGASMRSLNWAPLSRTLTKATYLKLPKHLARAIARLRFGANNLAVHRLAWENVEWEKRVCVCGCGDVETESYTLVHCALFAPDRAAFLQEMVEIHEDCLWWDVDRFMRILLKQSNVAESRIVGYFLKAVWREVNERYLG